MSEHEFEVGDVVRLKSGGPKMTISSIDAYSGKHKATCEWFVKETPKSAVYALEVLEKDEGGIGVFVV